MLAPLLVELAPLLASAPVALLGLGDEVLELGDALAAPCKVFDDSLLAPDVLGALDGLLEVPLVDGRLSSTSPADVPVVVVPAAALPVDGTQFVPLALELGVDIVAAPLAPEPLIEPEAEPVVPAAPVVVLAAAPDAPVVPAALVASFDDPPAVGVVPVPFAPFVVFSPVKR